MTSRRVSNFDYAMACSGAPDAVAVPSRAEIIGLGTVLALHGDVVAHPLPEPFRFDERFVFTHFIAMQGRGFLLGGTA